MRRLREIPQLLSVSRFAVTKPASYRHDTIPYPVSSELRHGGHSSHAAGHPVAGDLQRVPSHPAGETIRNGSDQGAVEVHPQGFIDPFIIAVQSRAASAFV